MTMHERFDPPIVASSKSTGGAGSTFEQHVGAYWLAQLLTGSIPPILLDTTITEIAFQTSHLGWHTDDFLVTCGPTGLTQRRLIGQAKRSITISASHPESKKTLEAFWKDFCRNSFSSANDQLVLVTLRGTSVLLEHFSGLLDFARTAHDADEFEARLANHLLSNKAIEYCTTLQEIVGGLEQRPVSRKDIWPFLRVLHVLSLDLFTTTGQTEAHIKSLLAHTTKDGNPNDAARDTWNALLTFAAKANSDATRVRQEDLPDCIRSRHSSISGPDYRILQALRDHSAIVNANITSTIGPDLHLPRFSQFFKGLEELEHQQVLLICGSAGSGKSAIAKDICTELAKTHFVFSFRAEEFAQPHLDNTLAQTNLGLSAVKLKALLATQDKKIIHVESIERLLENPNRDAFADLMGLVREDKAVRLVLTCRDYSVEQVCAIFLRDSAAGHARLNVPPLDNEELKHVEQARPELRIPLRSASLRNILRNPFFLNKALSIPWSSNRPAPQSEREFRMLFWSEEVRVDKGGVLGLGRQREEALQEISVRRARALTTHVPCDDLAPVALASLGRDSLIVSATDSSILFATSHDVVEDWAILQWLEEKHLSQADLVELSEVIGPHPAIRRSYRRWLSELVERDPAAADRLFTAAFSETGISAQFRDDTLVSLLKATDVAQFLARHETELLADDRRLLKRVIHLMRVSCVKAPDWSPQSGLNVPDGTVWPAVLSIVHHHHKEFDEAEHSILLGLVEDSVSDVSWWSPYLIGAEAIVAIAYHLLESLRGYSNGDERMRVLKVIAKLPQADATRFEVVLRGHIEEGRRRDVISEDLKELVFTGLDGAAFARELPDLFVETCTTFLLASEADLKDHDRYGSSMDLNPHFGMRPHLSRGFFPASAYKGPWIQFLHHHRNKALDFLIHVFNHSADWYAHPRIQDRLESPEQVTLKFADDTSKEQWVDWRLWGLFRGISVGPYVLQSLLMALEHWLLDFASHHPKDLDKVLIDILARSDNGALTAVVSSVAIAHPHCAGETLMALLSVPVFIALDRSRTIGEGSVAHTTDMLSSYGHGTMIYDEERKNSHKLSHRGKHLENAIFELQLGSLAPRVHAVIDQHRSVIPTGEGPGDDNLIWRLALKRMDLRQYNASVVALNQPNAEQGKDSSHSFIQFDPKPAEPSVQEMVDQSAVRFNSMGERLGLHMWGMKVFEREQGRYHSSAWKEKLRTVQSLERSDDEYDSGNHGPGYVAAVCIRDHWEELTPEQQTWCAEQVCTEVLLRAENWDPTARLSKFSFAADRPCSQVMPLLIDKDLPSLQVLIRRAFVCALTHPVNEVRQWFSWGINKDFWIKNRSIAIRCISALATEHSTFNEAWDEEQTKSYPERRRHSEILVLCIEAVRSSFWGDVMAESDAISNLDLANGQDSEAHLAILNMLHAIPDDPVAISAFLKLRTALMGWWSAGKDRRNRRERNYELESATEQHIAAFLVRTSQEAAQEILNPLLGLINTNSEEVCRFLNRITAAQDRNPNTPQFWFVWSMFAQAVKSSRWAPALSDEHMYTTDYFSPIFLANNWKEGVRHWCHLEGYADRIHELFNALPALALTLDSYARFLYHIGERELPKAFTFIAVALKRGSPQVMLKRSDTVYRLEVLLQRHVYGRPLELKKDAATRTAVLLILDNLVERGSASAFRMRDDFMTPAA